MEIRIPSRVTLMLVSKPLIEVFKEFDELDTMLIADQFDQNRQHLFIMIYHLHDILGLIDQHSKKLFRVFSSNILQKLFAIVGLVSEAGCQVDFVLLGLGQFGEEILQGLA